MSPDEYNTEFPPHSVSQGRAPKGYSGPLPSKREAAETGSDAVAKTTANDAKSIAKDAKSEAHLANLKAGQAKRDAAEAKSTAKNALTRENDAEIKDNEIENPDSIDSTGDGTPDDHGNIAPPPTIAAWITRAVTVGSLLFIVGYLLYLCFRPEVPANFDIEMDFAGAEERGGLWVLPVNVTNTSTEAMGGVTVEVVQGETTRTFQFSLMGEGERGEAEVRLPERPVEGDVEADVTSYTSP